MVNKINDDVIETLDDNIFTNNQGEIWRVSRLIFLSQDLEVFDLPLKHLNIKNCYHSIDNMKDYLHHAQRIHDADLQYPIILDELGVVMDGFHRIIKAWVTKQETIKAVRFEKTPHIVKKKMRNKETCN